MPRKRSRHVLSLSVIGAGYVGLVTGAAFAQLGHRVVVVEKIKERVEKLKRGIVPFYEPGLEKLVLNGMASKRLRFISDIATGVKGADAVIIAVGTPTLPDGRVSMRDYWSVISLLASHVKHTSVLINKSTVPVGTARRAKSRLQKLTGRLYDVVSFPEFLREGNAIKDFMQPDRLVIGTDSPHALGVLKKMIKPIRTKKLFTNIETAEMIKYASNAFLATKISFINEIANICEAVGADVDKVAHGMGLDPRIGTAFLKAGIGYGGSCFPKDVKALKHIAGDHDYKFRLLRAVIEVNTNQRRIAVKKVQKLLGNLKGKTISVLGLAFKNNTDDVRESAAIDIIRSLFRSGAKVIAHDPVAESNARKVLPEDAKIVYCDSAEQAAIDAEAIIIATEWKEFITADWARIRQTVKRPLIVDGRNLLDKARMQSLGFEYVAMGK